MLGVVGTLSIAALVGLALFIVWWFAPIPLGDDMAAIPVEVDSSGLVATVDHEIDVAVTGVTVEESVAALSGPLPARAGHEFVVVEISATNRLTDVTWLGSDFELVMADGTTYPWSWELQEQLVTTLSMGEELAPGTPLTAPVVFEVRTGSEPVGVRVSDFSLLEWGQIGLP